MFAFVFPGQGSQQVGMGKALAERFPVARRVYEEADDALGFSISKVCWEGPEGDLNLTANCQPAILTTSIAALRVLEAETGLSPIVVAGHSLGEFSALVCAKAMGLADAVRVVYLRGRFMQEAVAPDQGAMVAVMGAPISEVTALCAEAAQGDVLCPANYNGPTQTVVAGTREAVERLTALAQKRSWLVKPLRVSAPFHCSLMQPAAERLARELASLPLGTPVVPVLSNVSAVPHDPASSIAEMLVRQVTAPVQWEGCVRYMIAAGVREIVEVGAGTALSAMTRRMDEKLVLQHAGAPEDIDPLRARAQSELKAFVGPYGQWSIANDGSLCNEGASQVVWADTGKVEQVDETFWRINPNGSKVRKFGGLRVIWPDGRLEVQGPPAWRARRNGSFWKDDGSTVIHRDGRVETFDLAAWEITGSGTMKKKDGTRIIWSDGLEWDAHDQFAHGF
jgi:malonyl CoA-acyl carrier protein transacylase